MTVLYTTHYMEEAQELSDHIGIMDHGKLMALGTHEELIKSVGELGRIELTLTLNLRDLLATWRGFRRSPPGDRLGRPADPPG